MPGIRCGMLATVAASATLVATGGGAFGATLVGHWKFDEGTGTVANDSSAKGNHGTVYGATWTAGKLGGCLLFAGTDSSYVEIPNETDYDLKDAVSYAVWIKVDGSCPVGCDTWMGVITKGDHMSLQQRDETKYVVWQTKDAPGTISQYQLQSATEVLDGNWHHLACTFDGTDQEKRIYVDGNLDSYVEAIGYINTTDYPVIIGKIGMFAGHAFKGLIDDVRIYDGALTAAEVQAIFQAKGVKIEATDPNAEEAGQDPGEFTITRIGMDETVPLVVKIDSSASTATATADYTTNPDISGGTVTIPANSAYVTITVIPVDDTEAEGGEVVIITLQPDTYSILSPSEATVLIGDDDSPPGAFSLLTPADTAQDVAPQPTFTWETAAGAVDYTLVVADNASFTTPTLIHDDTLTVTSYDVAEGLLDYGNEYWWRVTAHNAKGDTPASNNDFSFRVGYGTPIVTIEASDPDAAENPVDTGAFLVTKAFGDPALALTVSFTFNTSTAELGVDYTANPDMAGGTVTIAPGTTQATITVTPIDDTLVDGGETVVIVLADGAEYDLGTPTTATVTISDDDIPTTVTDVTADGTPLPGAVLTSAPGSIVVTFSQKVDASTVTTDTFRLVRSGGDGTFGDGNEVGIVPTSVTLDGTGTQATMELTGVTTADDDYQVAVNGGNGPTAGLVGHWKLDDGAGLLAADSSPHGNDGILVSFPDDGSEWVAGRIDGALDFDGLDDYIDMGNTCNVTKDFTLAAWVRPDHLAGTHAIVGKVSGANNKQYAITIYQSTWFFDYERDQNNFTLSGGTPAAGVWQHVAVALDASLYITLYVNGIEVTHGFAPQETMVRSDALCVGRRGGSYASFYFDGLIDDVRIYERALSAAEVAALASTPAVTDLVGNPLDGEYSGSFPSGDGTAGGDFVCTFRIDTTAPAVAGTPPLEGATDVSISTDITVTFAEEMDQASTEAAFSIDPDAPGTLSWTDNTLTFTPSGPLDDDTTYTVTISTGAKDLVGYALGQAYTFTFTTEDLTAPADVTDYVLTPASEEITITWRNPYDLDFEGVVVLRSLDEPPTGSPADGTAYSAGNVIGNAVVVYVGEGATPIPGNRSSWQETGLENGKEYHYAVFAYDEAMNYSPGVSASAVAGEAGGGDGGLCSPGSSASPVLLALAFALAALAAHASARRPGT